MRTLILLTLTVFTAFSNNCNPPVYKCLSCKTQHGNECEKCEAEYYLKDNECDNCSGGCLNCSDADTCTKCKNGYYLYDKACTSCKYGCSECSDSKKCYDCFEGFILKKINAMLVLIIAQNVLMLILVKSANLVFILKKINAKQKSSVILQHLDV
ncbi:hypothetical protein EIN_239270 [Entamoeba invadens IP1]|uniref:CXXC-rich protein n=1 Tax=Entamoeba invadens IP1 TaxID=370355 RepID=A0A0A1UCR6_ENTIV|nr:hypothetical protein EIN_239270 [Entamoeba invadens IP1]ELP93627.1 hypothetical protein EIN_239270 [Entamoeba invadens IP1]|eukprot:XP_004260398.1 hypothetical protein EIN_239270 [Entamoeba invadens IP1]